MTAPAPTRIESTRTPRSGGGATSTAQPAVSRPSPFGQSTPPDHRTTALKSAVDILRGTKPPAAAQDVLDMAELFYQFLKKGG